MTHSSWQCHITTKLANSKSQTPISTFTYNQISIWIVINMLSLQGLHYINSTIHFNTEREKEPCVTYLWVTFYHIVCECRVHRSCVSMLYFGFGCWCWGWYMLHTHIHKACSKTTNEILFSIVCFKIKFLYSRHVSSLPLIFCHFLCSN